MELEPCSPFSVPICYGFVDGVAETWVVVEGGDRWVELEVEGGVVLVTVAGIGFGLRENGDGIKS